MKMTLAASAMRLVCLSRARLGERVMNCGCMCVQCHGLC